MQPKVSVILPFYKCEEHLSDAIESVLCQSLSQFELILINNNASAECVNIASQFANSDKRIKLIDEPRQGIVYALNKGIENAKAKYIARMDANDISFPERLEKQLSFLENNPDIGVVACQAHHLPTTNLSSDHDDLKEYVIWNNKLITHEDIELNRFIESPMIHSTVLFRKDLIGKYGSYLNGDFPEDYELWLRWLDKGVKMHKIPEILLEWRALPDRLNKKDDRLTDQAFFEAKSRYLIDWLKEHNQYFPEVVVWGAGRKSRQRFFILHELGIHAKFHIDLRANPSKKVIDYQQTPPAGRHFILSYVANRSARERIKIFLVELGYTEGKDFICVA